MIICSGTWPIALITCVVIKRAKKREMEKYMERMMRGNLLNDGVLFGVMFSCFRFV